MVLLERPDVAQVDSSGLEGLDQSPKLLEQIEHGPEA
jgi:hypothetical protein